MADRFPRHPFSSDVTAKNADHVLGHYYAMSQAFPYIQAGAYQKLVVAAIKKNSSISEDVEKTFVAGAYLSFDETGGFYHLRTRGISVLPEILNTGDLYHASLLRKDMEAITGRKAVPNYNGATRRYLLRLSSALGASDPVRRTASMVAFEMHADSMITALWGSLAREFPHINKDALDYFKIHVGGDDPQEAYHKLLTQKLTSQIVSADDESTFEKWFLKDFSGHMKWCRDICKT